MSAAPSGGWQSRAADGRSAERPPSRCHYQSPPGAGAGTAIAFVAALVGVFVMQSALQGDRRLVVAGFQPGEAIFARPSVRECRLRTKLATGVVCPR